MTNYEKNKLINALDNVVQNDAFSLFFSTVSSVDLLTSDVALEYLLLIQNQLSADIENIKRCLDLYQFELLDVV